MTTLRALLLTTTVLALAACGESRDEDLKLDLAADPDYTRRIEAAKAIIRSTGRGDIEETAVGQLATYLGGFYEGSPKELWDDLEREWITGGSFIQSAAEVWAKHLTTAELEAIASYYATDAGGRFSETIVGVFEHHQKLAEESDLPLSERWASDEKFRDLALDAFSGSLPEKDIEPFLTFLDSSAGKKLLQIDAELRLDLRKAGEEWATEREMEARDRLIEIGYTREQ